MPFLHRFVELCQLVSNPDGEITLAKSATSCPPGRPWVKYGAEQIENLASAVLIFEFDLRVIQTTNRIDMPRLMMPRHKTHVVVPRQRAPVAIWWAIVAVVTVGANVDIAQQAIDVPN